MKYLCALLLAIGCVSIAAGEGLKCTIQQAEKMPPAWRDMVDPCIKMLEAQVKVEIDAAITYLAMGAHFAKDKENRPGFSKLFFESATEEREHAIKIIEYLLMRGELTTDVSKLINPVRHIREEWANGYDALSDALTLEAQVTSSIRDIITTCESPKTVPNFNDYHLVDYLTGVFLDEQYKGQRDLAGKLSTLGKMMAQHGTLGEFLFDQKLLEASV